MCSTVLMSDPRVHRLIHATLDGGFYVAALAAESVLAPELETPRFMRQGERDLDEFAGELIDLLA